MRKIRSEITPRLNQLRDKLDALPGRAGVEFRNETPIRTGNARRNTNTVGSEIRANYPYATRLQNGYSSQARNGMKDPTIDWIKSDIRKW